MTHTAKLTQEQVKYLTQLGGNRKTCKVPTYVKEFLDIKNNPQKFILQLCTHYIDSHAFGESFLKNYGNTLLQQMLYKQSLLAHPFHKRSWFLDEPCVEEKERGYIKERIQYILKRTINYCYDAYPILKNCINSQEYNHLYDSEIYYDCKAVVEYGKAPKIEYYLPTMITQQIFTHINGETL